MYQIPELLKFRKLVHAFSMKEEGNMANVILGKEVNFKKTLENRTRFLEKLNITIDKCICMWVVHGDGVKEANPKDAGKSMKDYNFALKVDALLTNKKGLYLFLLVADCLPIILYDPKKLVVAVVHAGWTGADLNIVGKAVRTLSNKFRSKPEDLIVGLGPAARKDSFIKENPKQLNNPKWLPFLEEIDEGRYKVDFVGLCKKQLLDAQVEAKNIFDCKIDTIKDKRFFSHYREGKKNPNLQGRFACVVGIN